MQKDTKGKLKLNLVPNHGLEAVARVREFGNAKYPGHPNSYLDGVRVEDLVEACRRHLLQHQKGELLDKESLEMHLAHVATSAMMAIEILHRTLEVSETTLRDYQSLFETTHQTDLGRSAGLEWWEHGPQISDEAPERGRRYLTHDEMVKKFE